jgi:simple sugar transport system ATP-binding protein
LADTQAAAAPVLALAGITKRFGALVANDGISLQLARGEVLALLGENGAGKSTLVSILFGHYVADEGQIAVDGHPLPPGRPRAALAAGIGMVHQHFTLADNLCVLDNVMLGTEPLWRPIARRSKARQALLDTARRFGLQVDPDARVGELSVGERQRVEILKALTPIGTRGGARILILDEPTAVLTPQESEALFATLRQLVAQGLAVIFISHKLDEVLRVAHRVAVLRHGRLVLELPAQDARKADLAEAMVGRRVAPAIKRAHAPGEEVCALQGATLRGDGFRPLLDAVNLRVRAGEVLAVAGVAGNGQDALAQVLCGERALDAGHVRLGGQAMAARPGDWVASGAARIPEDRQAVGVVGDLAVWRNAVLERYARPAFARRVPGLGLGLVRRRETLAHARAIVERFDVRGAISADLSTPTRALSGGNMQKLILGRALMGDGGAAPAPPRLIVANQPTWGLDIGAVAFVHQQLLDACAQGAALLLISEDLDEVFALADRIAVMHHGRLGEARPAAEWTLAAIGLAMAGSAAQVELH